MSPPRFLARNQWDQGNNLRGDYERTSLYLKSCPTCARQCNSNRIQEDHVTQRIRTQNPSIEVEFTWIGDRTATEPSIYPPPTIGQFRASSPGSWRTPLVRAGGNKQANVRPWKQQDRWSRSIDQAWRRCTYLSVSRYGVRNTAISGLRLCNTPACSGSRSPQGSKKLYLTSGRIQVVLNQEESRLVVLGYMRESLVGAVGLRSYPNCVQY